MKKLLIGLFLVSSVLAFSQRVVKGSQAYDEKGVVYIQGEKTPYTGVLQNINEKGILESEAEYKDGKMNGFSKLYYPNGKLGSEATFKDNVQDGLQKDYFEDGKVKLEIPYSCIALYSCLPLTASVEVAETSPSAILVIFLF